MMRKLISLLLALVFLITALPVLADSAMDEKHMIAMRVGMALTAQMMENTLDESHGELMAGQKSLYAKRFISFNFLKPEKAVVLELSNDDVDTVCKALNVEKSGMIVTALGKMLNTTYSEGYAQAAQAVSATTSFNFIRSDRFTLVLLAYPTELSLVSLDNQGEAQSVFIISDFSVPNQINEAYIKTYAEKVGLGDPHFTVYDQERFDSLMNIVDSPESREYNDQWHDSSDETGIFLTQIVIKSEASMRTLLPFLIGSKYFSSESAIPSLIDQFLAQQWDGKDLSKVRFISEELAPKIKTVYGSDWRFTNSQTEGQLPLNQLPTLLDTPSANGEKENATFILIMTDERPETDATHYYDLMVQAAFPVMSIPKDVESADYIIHAVTSWPESYVVNGINVHNAYTTLTLYDAQTGQFIRELDTFISKPTGYIVVFSSEYYKWPSQNKLLNAINGALF